MYDSSTPLVKFLINQLILNNAFANFVILDTLSFQIDSNLTRVWE